MLEICLAYKMSEMLAGPHIAYPPLSDGYDIAFFTMLR